MRIPYAPDTAPSPDVEDIYARIRERRLPRPLIPLDLAMLHNPAIADGYNSLVGAIRNKSSLPVPLMELAISYIAVLTNATYEWKSHSALAHKAGVSLDKLQRLLDQDRTWAGFDDTERAVLEFTEQSTRQVHVDAEVLKRARDLLGTDQKVMELTITVGAYNMVSAANKDNPECKQTYFNAGAASSRRCKITSYIMAEKRKVNFEGNVPGPRRSVRLKSRHDSKQDLRASPPANVRMLPKKRTRPGKQKITPISDDVAAPQQTHSVPQGAEISRDGAPVPRLQPAAEIITSTKPCVNSSTQKLSSLETTEGGQPGTQRLDDATTAADPTVMVPPNRLSWSLQTAVSGEAIPAKTFTASQSEQRTQASADTTIPADLAARLNDATGTMIAEAERRTSDGRPPRFTPPVWIDRASSTQPSVIRVSRSRRGPSLQISPRTMTIAQGFAQTTALRREAAKVVPQQRLADMARLFSQSKAWNEAKSPAVDVIPEVVLQDLVAKNQPVAPPDEIEAAHPSAETSAVTIASGWRKWLDEEREKLLAEDNEVTSTAITGQRILPVANDHRPTVESDDEHDDTTISISEIEASYDPK